MKRVERLEAKVKSLYLGNEPGRDEWADWLRDNHVFVVADYATELAKRYGANEELARVAALLHDIADIRMERINDAHEEASLRISRELMQEADYSEADVKLVVDDAIRYHSCHGDERPDSVEGKILSTADSLAHLKTDFYLYVAWAHGGDWSLEKLKQWTLKKIERDFHAKIFFEDTREEVTPDYQMIRELFSR